MVSGVDSTLRSLGWSSRRCHRISVTLENLSSQRGHWVMGMIYLSDFSVR